MIIMKKVFAILMSLLFLVSVFGVAQTMATAVPTPCGTEYYKISSDTVKVGQTFTISLYTNMGLYNTLDPLFKVKIEGKSISGPGSIDEGIQANGGLPYRIGPVELINADYYDADWNLIHSGLVFSDYWGAPNPEWSQVRWITWTFRAVSPGTLNLTNPTCNDTETVTILSKDLPFKFFAKLFGFGKKD